MYTDAIDCARYGMVLLLHLSLTTNLGVNLKHLILISLVSLNAHAKPKECSRAIKQTIKCTTDSDCITKARAIAKKYKCHYSNEI